MSTSWKVWLKEMRWPSFSVSTRTPSQSNRRAEGRVEEEDAEAEQLNLRVRGGTFTLVVVFGFDILREERVVKDDGGRWSLSLVCLRRQWVFGWGVVGVKSEAEEMEIMLLVPAIDDHTHLLLLFSFIFNLLSASLLPTSNVQHRFRLGSAFSTLATWNNRFSSSGKSAFLSTETN